jgi:hypothetical protein
MEFGEIMGSINYPAVIVAALSSFIIGWLWYGPLFGKIWMKLNGFSKENIKEGGMSMPIIMIINFVATFLAAFALAMFLGAESDLFFGIFAGFMIAIFWIATSRLNDVLYERKPFGLFLINIGYSLVTFIVMGAIIGMWH